MTTSRNRVRVAALLRSAMNDAPNPYVHAPKGQNKSAQGNALGTRPTKWISPVGATQSGHRVHRLCRPYRAQWAFVNIGPRALPWAGLRCPVGAEFKSQQAIRASQKRGYTG